MATRLVNWLPLLLLALLWTLVTWCHPKLFPGTVSPIFWPFFALGSAAYLLTLAGFVFFGNRDRPVDASTRTATALAVGAAIIFAVYAWAEWTNGTNLPSAVPAQSNAAKSDGNDPLSSVNIFAAILGVVLAAVALIAQKSAADARAEAEKAKAEAEKTREDMRIVDAEMKTLAWASRLLERAQEAKSEADNLSKMAKEIVSQDPDLARFLELCADGLENMAKFFVLIHHWILEPRLTPSDDLAQTSTTLTLSLEVLGRNTQAVGQHVHERKQKLRTVHWQPAGRVIENLLRLLPDLHPSEAVKMVEAVHRVRTMLAQL